MATMTDRYQTLLQQTEANKPAAYKSSYQSTIDGLLDKITNREAFSYDFNADPLYQQYKDQYTQLGNQAAINTMTNAANLTGGYGNSYAATAASQANQQYLSQLNNVIPELYEAAMNKYELETNTLNNQYSTITDAEDRNYNRYRDTVSDWQTDRNYYNSAYNNSYSNDLNAAAQAEEQRQFDLNYALDLAQYNDSKLQIGSSAKASSGGGGGDDPLPLEDETNLTKNTQQYEQLWSNIMAASDPEAELDRIYNDGNNKQGITDADYELIYTAIKNREKNQNK